MCYEALANFQNAFENIFYAIYGVGATSDAGCKACITTAVVGEIIAFARMKYGFYVRDKKREDGKL